MSFKSSLYMLRGHLAIPAQMRQVKEAISHDKLSADEIREMNWRKRLDMLRFAYENSPYYEKLYKDAGLEPGDVKTEEDWAKVPMLTREALRENFETIKVRHPQSTYKMHTTGGSTGQPSRVLKDDSFSSRGMNWRAKYSWAGVNLGENSATIMRAHPASVKAKLYQFFSHFPAHNLFLDAGDMTDDTMRKFLGQWQRYQPKSVTSYVGGIHQLALFCLEHGIVVPSPEAIFTVAAPLYPIVKNDIRRVFGCPVFDEYVATEAHPMAGQCRCLAESGSCNLHVHSDYRHLEFVDDHGAPKPIGEYGDTLVSDLGDRVFPIVRYRIGDRGSYIAGKCSCGLPYPLMGPVHGRSFDFISLEHGRLAGECWATAFDNCLNAVHNFQIHQFADKSVSLSVVLNKNYPEADRRVREVAADLQRQLGRIPLTVKYEDFIPHDRGKIKYIISEAR